MPLFDVILGARKAPQSAKVKESEAYLKEHPALKGKLDAALNACLAAQGRAWPEVVEPIAYISGALCVTPYLASNLEILGAEEMRLATLLVTIGQTHLFADWPAAGKRDEEKHALFTQLHTLDSSYPGGLRAYYASAKKLLSEAKAGCNPLGEWTPEVPSGQRVSAGSEHFFALEKAGMDVIGQTAFVLVAGGLGERLGYKGIKIALPVDSVSGKSFMQWYAEYILAFQARCCRGGRTIQLAIMTSDDTHARTLAFLESNKYFGLALAQVTLIKQEKVAALMDNEAHFARASRSFLLDTKPHGHGDVHHLLWSSGLATAWGKAGVRYVSFFQDTNALAFRAMACLLGVSVKSRLEYNSLTVPRMPGEAVGGIARLMRPDGASMTVNVEYNQLDPLLRATVSPEGDVADASGYSPFPGNINVIAIELGPYLKILEQTGGSMPEFVNPKYNDAERTRFNKPTRVESMMQDYPKLLGIGARVGFTQLDRWICFSPVKNAVADAAFKAAKKSLPECAASGEADMYLASA
ncbi:UDP-N-acetylhexosamine pyrophosphorylase, partial [Pavlovales sp. CCMP2436]